MFIHSELKKKLLAGGQALGTFVGTDSSDLVDILGRSGFDFVILDMEHAQATPHSMMGQVRAAECRGMDVIVRVTSTERTTVLRALDMGVSGLLAPQVNDSAAARSFAEATLYPPLGCRGFGTARASAYGTAPVGEYIAEANADLLRIVQCETEQSVQELEHIARLKSIDAIFVGPYDLSLSLGCPGEFSHPRMTEAIDRVLAVCKKNNKIPAIFTSSPGDAKKRLEQGFTLIAFSVDVLIFSAAAKNAADAVRSLMRHE